ncbi:MAG: DsbA family protein [Gemmatimonadetes bacterium]|nr:DsbA family protein [Gemmatimonadota bacterium]
MATVTPKKKSGLFLPAVVAILAIGTGVIYWQVQANKPKPITLAASTPLPKAEGYLRGNPDAPVTIIEFADFECPGCANFATVQEPDVRTRLVDAGLANFRFYDFPLTQIHANTLSAHLAASCANEQGKFWELHDAIFAAQNEWNTQATSNPRKVLDRLAGEVGLDMARFGACFDSQRTLPQIQANAAEGTQRGVSSTPTLLIGNRLYPGGLPYDDIKKLVDSLRAAPAAAPAPAPAP